MFEEQLLSDLVKATGGAYHPVPGLETLEVELALLVKDLLKQYQISYTTLRGQGAIRARIEVRLDSTLYRFDSEQLDATAFSGRDSEGRIVVDTPEIDPDSGVARASVRALHVPRNVGTLMFRMFADGDVAVDLATADQGGLIEDWSTCQTADHPWPRTGCKETLCRPQTICSSCWPAEAHQQSMGAPVT